MARLLFTIRLYEIGGVSSLPDEDYLIVPNKSAPDWFSRSN